MDFASRGTLEGHLNKRAGRRLDVASAKMVAAEVGHAILCLRARRRPSGRQAGERARRRGGPLPPERPGARDGQRPGDAGRFCNAGVRRAEQLTARATAPWICGRSAARSTAPAGASPFAAPTTREVFTRILRAAGLGAASGARFLGACSPRTPGAPGATEAAAFFDAPFFEDLDWRALGERALPPPLPKAPGDSDETFVVTPESTVGDGAVDAGDGPREVREWRTAPGRLVSSAATAR
ncbi:serine/threonine kinase [Aureococcus anophagefferens]|nr:serine/threonine kinase [Aureococcus anophagefferens]